MNAAIITGYASAFLLLAAVIWRTGRKRRSSERERAAAAQARIEREPCDYDGLLPPAPDNWPGTDPDVHDECELIWAMPARNPGLDRLRQAIRDEQQKGDQS